MSPRLVIFDVDGTLVDSQAHIVAAMSAAFAALGRQAPPRGEILSIVGLSLPVAIARLAPEARPHDIDALVDAYRAAFSATRHAEGSVEATPLYPGAAEALARMSRRDDLLLGIATGKSLRGLAHVLGEHRLGDLFATRQTADGHPSKPNPAMVLAAMTEVGVTAEHTAMVGDTTFDMEMARAAGVAAIGVSWGYHPVERLRQCGADAVLASFADLDATLDAIWTRAA